MLSDPFTIAMLVRMWASVDGNKEGGGVFPRGKEAFALFICSQLVCLSCPSVFERRGMDIVQPKPAFSHRASLRSSSVPPSVPPSLRPSLRSSVRPLYLLYTHRRSLPSSHRRSAARV